MRVAMGLFVQEAKDREEWVIRLYNLYKSPPLLLQHAHPLQLRHPAQPALELLPLQGG